jgi:hypothetical protein
MSKRPHHETHESHQDEPTSYDAPPPTAAPTDAAAAMSELISCCEAMLAGLKLLHPQGHELLVYAEGHLNNAKAALGEPAS